MCAGDAQHIAQDAHKFAHVAQIGSKKPAHIAHDEALLQATYRIGWLESRIESMQRALTEGVEAAQKREAEARQEAHQKEDAIEKERAAVLELDRHLQDERARRQAVEREKVELEARLRELELPWWKKMFR
jgi:chromosome segregation ATPase